MNTVSIAAPIRPIIAANVSFDGYRIYKLNDYKAG